MRIRYVGIDDRTRIAEAVRVKFIHDGWNERDKRNELIDDIHGPVIVAHTDHIKNGKRLIMSVPDGFDMEAAKINMLEKGWLDLSSCQVKTETNY
jgi:hypothetical protein